jgi:hypothetical protein
MSDVKESSKNICFPIDSPEERAVAIKIIDRVLKENEEELD